MGFHIVGSCRPLSRFMVSPLLDEDGLSRSSLPVSRDIASDFGLIPVNGVEHKQAVKRETPRMGLLSMAMSLTTPLTGMRPTSPVLMP